MYIVNKYSYLMLQASFASNSYQSIMNFASHSINKMQVILDNVIYTLLYDRHGEFQGLEQLFRAIPQ